MLGAAVPQIGVGVFSCMIVSRWSWAGECLKCSFRLTRGGPYLHGVIGSTVGTHPRGTGSNPIEGNGHFFLILSALSFVFL